MTVLPQFALALIGAAAGWIVAGAFLFRARAPMEYQKAVKHLRKSEYAEAVQTMDILIKSEPRDPNHYRFRAELLRLWGKLDKARKDYQRMTELDPQSAVAYNGLAEVYLQSGDYDPALEAAQRAAELAPDEWVAYYNLGMIEDRLERSPDVIEHLERALALKVPDARHRLLMYLYIARANARLGNASGGGRTPSSRSASTKTGWKNGRKSSKVTKRRRCALSSALTLRPPLDSCRAKAT